MKNYNLFYFLIITVLIIIFGKCGFTSKPQSFVETVSDPKEWKKLLRTRTNILVLYTNGKVRSDLASVFVEVSREIRGSATLVQIDCSGDGKKLCKKNRVDNMSSYTLKHYKDGDYHKDYDRRETTASMITFLRDPAGDLPWDEDPIGGDVIHVQDVQSFNRLIKREKDFMMMFYAPWCGFCKRLKPDYSAAATELKFTHVLAAIDVHRPENSAARIRFNITGFPTLIYFENGVPKYNYEGENNKAGIVNFMKNPGPAKEKPKEEEWSDIPSDVVHLTDKTFHQFVKDNPSVMVMFYAPWCGHCKKMKPEYVAAAKEMKEKGIDGILAAFDSTKEKSVSEEFKVKGFPTLKYFNEGQFAFDLSAMREKDKIIKFMMDPKEPPPPPPAEKPWAETESAVFHLTEDTFKSFLKKKKHVLVMFYAPWCGHCKKAKPEFTAAADKFSEDSKVEFAAVDCTEHLSVCSQYDVNGYPTFIYFNYFKNSRRYNGGRTESDFVRFMNDPDQAESLTPSTPTPSDPKKEWEALQGSQFLQHLTEADFDSFVANKMVLVLFYAPWCGHCKAMKVDFALASEQLNEAKIDARLAYVDSTMDRPLSLRFGVKGFPTLKLLHKGVEIAKFEGARTAANFVSFIKENLSETLSKKTEL